MDERDPREAQPALLGMGNVVGVWAILDLYLEGKRGPHSARSHESCFLDFPNFAGMKDIFTVVEGRVLGALLPEPLLPGPLLPEPLLPEPPLAGPLLPGPLLPGPPLSAQAAP